MNVIAANKIDNIDLNIDEKAQFLDKHSKKSSLFEKILLSLKKAEENSSKQPEKSNNLLDNSSFDKDLYIIEIENRDLNGNETVDSKEQKNIKFFEEDINRKTLLKIKKSDILHKNLISHFAISKRVEQESAINEIKEAKGLDDILKIAKKYRLNIRRVDLKQTQMNEKGEHKNRVKKDLNEKNTIKKRDSLLQPKSLLLNTKIEHSIKVLKEQKSNKKEEHSLKELLQKSLSGKESSVEKSSKDRIDLQSALISKKDNSKKSSIKIETKLKSLDEVLPDDSSKNIDEKSLRNIEIEKRVAETKEVKENKKEKTEHLFNNKETETVETKKVAELENSINKSEIIKQKVIDAKQMVLSFAKTLQEQVENYKPPFTRMQLSLDPEDLGKVDVTLISRGKNLHIQVNSNPVAIGVMAIQGSELKNQLTSMGFSDVQMQFNMNQQQQQQQQERRKSSALKEYLKIDEIPEVDSLEIIVPNYA